MRAQTVSGTASRRAIGIRTAKDFYLADPDIVQGLLTIVGRKIQAELKGFSCLPLEMVRPDKKQIISSRSFGKPVFERSELEKAVAQYVTRASEKLRKQQSTCHALSVFVHPTNSRQAALDFSLLILEGWIEAGRACTKSQRRQKVSLSL